MKLTLKIGRCTFAISAGKKYLKFGIAFWKDLKD